jgi:hypothetical protein
MLPPGRCIENPLINENLTITARERGPCDWADRLNLLPTLADRGQVGRLAIGGLVADDTAKAGNLLVYLLRYADWLLRLRNAIDRGRQRLR